MTLRCRGTISTIVSETSSRRSSSRPPTRARYAKWILAGTLAYTLSPIDLIPDFVPIVGHLDDVVIVPLAIWAVRQAIPNDVMTECRHRATTTRRVR